MRVAALSLALLALSVGCRTVLPAVPLAQGDPRPRALLEAWRVQAAGRDALHAVARFAVDAPGAGVAGADLSLRSKQRMWLARPAKLRVEVLGFLDTTLAVLTTDGEEYALFEASERSFDAGPVYDGLLWDAAGLDLSPTEAVEVILGAPRPDAGLVPAAAYAVDGRVRIELADAAGGVQRTVEFDAGGELRRLAQADAQGGLLWEASFDDYVEIRGVPFARQVALRSGSGQTRARLTLRDVELNPSLSPELFRLRPGGIESPPAAEGG